MFQYILLGTVGLIAATAGYFSVSGIGQLFVGSPIAAMVMAGSLEVAKLVTISTTYRYWNRLHQMLRAAFIGASVILMMITSIGVYGYLSSAYAVSATGIKASQNQIQVIQNRQTSIDSSVARLSARVVALQSVRAQQENRLDVLVGKRGLADQQKVIATSDAQIDKLQQQITMLTATRDSLSVIDNNLRTQVLTNGKLGTFYYIAESIGVPLDTIVTWFILAIVLVFDPLSVMLVLVYNITQQKEDKVMEENTNPFDAFTPKEREGMQEIERQFPHTFGLNPDAPRVQASGPIAGQIWEPIDSDPVNTEYIKKEGVDVS